MMDAMEAASFTGALLVAAPTLEDPNFDRSVIFLVDHDEEGALGVVLNRPTTLDVREILPVWHDYAVGPSVVFRGGPVGEDSALAIAATVADDEPMGFRQVHGRLGLIDLDAPPELLAAEIRSMRVFAGYAGWGPGQLEDELAEHAWFVVDAAEGDPFSPAPDQLWRSVLRRQGGALAMLAHFPADPSLN